MRHRPILVLAVAEGLSTALWFTPNAVMAQLQAAWALTSGDLGWLTGAVQVGFLLGTLGIGLTGLADRLDASRLFAVACLLGALSNALLPWADGLAAATALRMMTGMALAGIYPIGMKLMVGWAPDRTGLGLAWLVGMLVLGTAMPHLLAGLTESMDWNADWRTTLWLASILALIGALLVWHLGEAPAVAPTVARTRERPSRLGGLRAFGLPRFRHAACAYFGHMWELYTLWALIPLMLSASLPSLSPTQLALASFALVAIGAPGCWLGGALSQRQGSRAVATAGLAGSALCAALYPVIALLGDGTLSASLLLGWLALWSLLAVIDSPQFSALSADACPAPWLGSALTLQNAIGFAISAISLIVLLPLLPVFGVYLAWALLPGPLLGLLALSRLRAHPPRA